MAQFGCIWPKGELHREDALKAVGEDGRKIPLQSRIMAYYKDGSIKWTAQYGKGERAGRAFLCGTVKERGKRRQLPNTLFV